MTEEEILIRAREASIVAGYTRGLGITSDVAAADEKAIRAGRRDSNWSVLCAAQALRDVSKPLSEILPPDSDLLEARELGFKFQALSKSELSPNYSSGLYDHLPEVRLALAAIKRGRELESKP